MRVVIDFKLDKDIGPLFQFNNPFVAQAPIFDSKFTVDGFDAVSGTAIQLAPRLAVPEPSVLVLLMLGLMSWRVSLLAKRRSVRVNR